MKTRKSISSISYNTTAFLRDRLNELISLGHISYYFFIEHNAESNEKKDHTHLFLEPAKQIQTDDICKFLIQPDPFNHGLPLKTMPFMSSHFSDWYLYVLHDPVYLSSKGLHREYSYRKEFIEASDPDILDYLVMEISNLEVTGMDKILSAVQSGHSFRDMVMRGQVPIEQFRNYEQVYHFLSGDDSEWALLKKLLHDLKDGNIEIE